METWQVQKPHQHSKAKRHHYIPEMIQRNFAGSDLHLWSFDKKKAAYGIKRKPIALLFRKWDLYTYIGTDGSRDRFPEGQLSQIETRADPVIKRIISEARQGRLAALSEFDRQCLATFIIAQLRRSPDNFEVAMARLDIQADVTRNISEAEADGLRISDEVYTDIASGKFERRLRQNLMALSAPQPLHHASDAVQQRGFSVGVAEANRSFILGSSPIARLAGHATRSNGLIDPTAEAWLPIARDVALCSFSTRHHEKLVQIKDAGVRKINSAIAVQSSVIASGSRDLIVSFSRRFARVAARR